MDFKIGFLIKPNEILENNEITFISSSGVKPANYTESDCLAYGFIYNDSKCWSVQNSTSFLPPDNQNILQAGANNIIGLQSSDCSIIGINNELRFNDKNSLIVGDRNVINDDVNNTIVSGTKGDATATNSIVLGGNTTLAGTSPLGNELVLNGDFSQEGSEKVTNGDFSNGTTDWSAEYSSTLSIVGGQLKIVGGRAAQSITTVIGKSYSILATITDIDTNGGIRIKVSNNSNLDGAYYNSAYNNTTTPVLIESIFTATATTTYIGSDQNGTSTQSALLDNVSVKEVGQNWSLGTGVTISGGNAIFNNSTANNNGIYQAAVFQTNTQYKITAEVSNYSSGNVTAWSGGSQNINSNESFTGNGTKTWIISTGASNGYLLLSSATTNGNFNIDNVSVKEQSPYIAPRQSIKLMYGGTTTNDTSTPLYLNTIVDKYLNIPINTAITFNADILALRVGGTAAGENGDYASWIERGVIINKNGVISVSTTNTPVVSNGTTTGWIPSSAMPTSPELVTNGNFTTNLNSWTINNSDRSNSITWSTNGALFRLPNTSPVTTFSSGASTIVGKSYNLVVEVVNYVSGSIKIDGNGVSELFNSSGTFTRVITPSNTAPITFYRASSNVNLTVRSVSLKEIIPPTGTNYNINVVGAVNTTIEWASTINFTQITTNTTL